MAGKRTGQEPFGQEGSRLGRELAGLVAIFCGLLLLLSLATFDSRDPWLNHVVSGMDQVHNRAGLFGAYLSGALFDVFGLAAWVAPAFFCLLGVRRILSLPAWDWWRWSGVVLMVVCLALAGAARDVHVTRTATSVAIGLGDISNHGGGLLGHFLYEFLVNLLSTAGTFLVWIFLFLLGTQMLSGFSWLTLTKIGAGKLLQAFIQLREKSKDRKRNLTGNPQEHFPPALPLPAPEPDSRAAIPLPNIVRLEEPPEEPSAISKPISEQPGPSEAQGLPPGVIPVDEDADPPAAPYSLLPENHGVLRMEPCGGEEDVPPWVLDFESERADPAGGAILLDKYASSPGPSGQSGPLAAGQEGQSQPDHSPSGNGKMQEVDYDGVSLSLEEAPVQVSPDQLTIQVNERPDVPPAHMEQPGLLRKTLDLVTRPDKIPLPPLELLGEVQVFTGGAPRSVLEQKGASLMTCLMDFGIQGELVGITPGPVVTMFEFKPAPGIRVSRISGLSDDLALALKAVAVRIQAPVPGTDTVGIEIPNETRETVYLRELIGSKLFQEANSLLTLALGKDIAGNPAVADLATMPHLLVAGATGAGKSVGINSIILSLIYKARPDQVKLLLVDPKRVEMAIYADLPHLVHPVVTEMQLAKNALEWAVKEMERRYEDIARAGVRNIADYNAKIVNLGPDRPENLQGLEHMPYLVIIIDELADLMLVGAKEVETCIVRLAQLARAAGIHLILATQRPSVDVVTGLIKANFPCRIAFQVTSKHDSRTILDTVGAEHLLGKGDMLFKPGGGKFQRMHGAFVTDSTVQAVTDYWRSMQLPDYKVDFSSYGLPEGGEEGGFTGGEDISSDPMYLEAVEFVRQQGKASISLIQRKFRIGFNKAARLIEQMERDGIVGPADGSKPRMVL